MDSKLIVWIKKELQLRNWSIRELARKSGISHAYIADILRGDKDVTWNFCLAIAHGFNEPVWNVFILAGMLDKVPEELVLDENRRLLLRIFNELPGSVQDEALSYLKWLAARQN